MLNPIEAGARVMRDSAARRLVRMLLLSLGTGILCGLAARGTEEALRYMVPRLIGSAAQPGAASSLRLRFDWRILAYPAIGGLLSGILVRLLCRPSSIHGNGVLIDAFHNQAGRISLKDAGIKAAASVGVISLGGSVGKEGPIAVFSASIGSGLARLFRLSPREVRLFLVAGCGAGVGAIFQCPLGGALFAATVLYRDPDIEGDAVLPALVSSVVSYSTFMAFGGFGQRLLRGTDQLRFSRPMELLAYGALSIACAGAAILMYACLHGTEGLKKRMRIPAWLAPAGAGLAVGAIALVFPQVMDAKYEFIQSCISPQFVSGPWMTWAVLLALVVLAKCVATGLMIGTDTAGGLFGPVVFVGGAVGAAVGALLEALFPGHFPEPLRQAMIPVGMAGMLASSLRIPMAAVVMVMEMTGSYGLIVPLMLTSVLSYLLGRRWGLYDVQVATQEHSPAHVGKAVVGLLDQWKVRDFVEDWPHVASPSTTLPKLVASIPDGTRPLFVVLDGTRLVGVVSTGDIVRASESGPSDAIVAMDIMTSNPRTLSPGDSLYGTLPVFRELGQPALPVADVAGNFLGMLTRHSIYLAIRERVSAQRADLAREHADIAALDRDEQLEALLSGLSAPRKRPIQRVSVPPEVIGKSLREADFRRTYGEVVAIETAAGELLAPPDPGRAMKGDDTLVLLPRTPEGTGVRRAP